MRILSAFDVYQVFGRETFQFSEWEKSQNKKSQRIFGIPYLGHHSQRRTVVKIRQPLTNLDQCSIFGKTSSNYMISYKIGEHYRIRASFQTCLKFPNLNRYELWMLVQLSSYLEQFKREIVSKKLFFESITGNGKRYTQMMGYYYGLLRKGFCGSYEYVSRPGSESVGISELGYSALRVYEGELLKIVKSQRIKANERQAKMNKGKYILRVIPDAIRSN